jgi:hypothetical protein
MAAESTARRRARPIEIDGQGVQDVAHNGLVPERADRPRCLRLGLAERTGMITLVEVLSQDLAELAGIITSASKGDGQDADCAARS